MDPAEIAVRFLEHYRKRGTEFLPEPSDQPGHVRVRHPSGPDILITGVQFLARVRGFLADSGVAMTSGSAETVARAARDAINAGAE